MVMMGNSNQTRFIRLDRSVGNGSISVIAAFVFMACCFGSTSTTFAADPDVAVNQETESAEEAVDESSEVAVLAEVGPRALSRAFRMAARKATPSVVTILTYGQPRGLQRPPAGDDELQEDDDGNGEADGETTPQDNQDDDEQDQPDNSDSPGDDAPDADEGPSADELTGIGSGVIISEDGLVITNNHVITGAKRVVVQLADDTEIEATEVRGDPDSDVAVLRIHRNVGFIAAEIADSSKLEIGDWVLTIGSPFRLEATVSAGIVSAKNRKLRRIARGRLIQTDAAINPGNSGGPVVDLDGRVVAISTAIATRNGGYQGIGFAIPINHAKWVADELAQHGKVRRAAIGATLVELKPRIAEKFNLPPYLGVLVYQIIEGSVAEKAGLKQLDVILEFAGERVRDPADLREVIERKPIGSVQDVVVLRAGKEVDLQIELAPADDPTGETDDPTGETDDPTGEK